MNKLLAMLLLAFVTLLNSCAPANHAPTSADELKEKFEMALKAGDTNAILSLYNWDGVSNDMKSLPTHWLRTLPHFPPELSTNETHIFTFLRPLPDDFEMESVRNGIRYRPNVAIVGMMDGTAPGWGVGIPYGETNGHFYLAGTISEKIYEPKTKDKILVVDVNCGVITDDSPTFTGTFTYVQNGVEIKKDIKGKGTAHKITYGDYIKSCFVQNASGGTNLLKLEIWENGKKIFDPEIVETNGSISYEKKN